MRETGNSQQESTTTVRQRKSRITVDHWLALLFITPSVILIGVFVYGFIGWTGVISFTNWNSLVPDYSFAGLKNYLYLFKDFRFQADLRNTLFFTLFFIAGVVILGQLLALLLDQKIRGETFFRNLFMFPMALSFVVTGVAWRWIFNPEAGINLLLEKFNAASLWYTNTTILPSFGLGKIEFGLPLALISVIIAAVWQMTGFSLAMYLAGLRAIPDDLREAARIDGANEWQVYIKILLPQLRPITFGVSIMMLHISLKIFDLIYTMTGSGANFVTDMPALYMYDAAFRANDYAQGAAVAIVMLILIGVIIVPYLIRNLKGSAR